MSMSATNSSRSFDSLTIEKLDPSSRAEAAVDSACSGVGNTPWAASLALILAAAIAAATATSPTASDPTSEDAPLLLAAVFFAEVSSSPWASHLRFLLFQYFQDDRFH